MNEDPRLFDIFMDVQRGLPRQGPGCEEGTLRALSLCSELPEGADLLDVGCGPGMQTVALAKAVDGDVAAVDIHREYLNELKDRAEVAGVASQIAILAGDMKASPFAPERFDLIWSEGAAYIMGFGEAFKRWKDPLRPRGYMAVTELTWLTSDPPVEAAKFFAAEYPVMADIATNLATIEAAGYDIIGHFTLPDANWWDHYYTPLEAKLPGLRAKYAGDKEALGLVEMTAREIDVRRRFGDSYGYEFFIARAVDPDAVPPGEPALTNEAQQADDQPGEGPPQPQFPPPLD
jgi:SAM-dependent methyltransferase